MKNYKITIEGKEIEVNVDALNIEDIPMLHRTAIAMALHLYQEYGYAQSGYQIEDLHDEESGKLTIKNVDRRYSPWNSKVFGINNRF